MKKLALGPGTNTLTFDATPSDPLGDMASAVSAVLRVERPDLTVAEWIPALEVDGQLARATYHPTEAELLDVGGVGLHPVECVVALLNGSHFTTEADTLEIVPDFDPGDP